MNSNIDLKIMENGSAAVAINDLNLANALKAMGYSISDGTMVVPGDEASNIIQAATMFSKSPECLYKEIMINKGQAAIEKLVESFDNFVENEEEKNKVPYDRVLSALANTFVTILDAEMRSWNMAFNIDAAEADDASETDEDVAEATENDAEEPVDVEAEEVAESEDVNDAADEVEPATEEED